MHYESFVVDKNPKAKVRKLRLTNKCAHLRDDPSLAFVKGVVGSS